MKPNLEVIHKPEQLGDTLITVSVVVDYSNSTVVVHFATYQVLVADDRTLIDGFYKLVIVNFLKR